MSVEIGHDAQSIEQMQGNGQLALALCRALMICLVRVDDRFMGELSGSLAEVAEKLKDEKGAEAQQLISNLQTFSRSLAAEPEASAVQPRGHLH
jgi:predicted nuclease with TOPRIM domain